MFKYGAIWEKKSPNLAHFSPFRAEGEVQLYGTYKEIQN